MDLWDCGRRPSGLFVDHQLHKPIGLLQERDAISWNNSVLQITLMFRNRQRLYVGLTSV